MYHRPWLRLGVGVTVGLSLCSAGLFVRAHVIGVEPPWNALWLPVAGAMFLVGAWVQR
jgi:hypothetical protein